MHSIVSILDCYSVEVLAVNQLIDQETRPHVEVVCTRRLRLAINNVQACACYTLDVGYVCYSDSVQPPTASAVDTATPLDTWTACKKLNIVYSGRD